ncbi:hypothetical protein V8D89_015110 [Ganoderma adspersum]
MTSAPCLCGLNWLDVCYKVLLLGSGDSGKSTILKQMRLAHRTSFSPHEIESFRQLIFVNLTCGLKCVIDDMLSRGQRVTPENRHMVCLLKRATDIKDHEPFPANYLSVLRRLWEDPNVQEAYARGNEAALPDYLPYYYADLDRFFKRSYVPSEGDIAHSYSRTIGIAERMFRLPDRNMLVVDVGGQRSERRKWIHCFQDAMSVVFVASLSGYDQCLTEDENVNQMRDAMKVWEVLCHSPWFDWRHMILILNKNDLFESKIQTSHIVDFFPASDYDGEKGDAEAGREYFKKRFASLAEDNPRAREIHIYVTTATDTAAFRVVLASVEGACRVSSSHDYC